MAELHATRGAIFVKAGDGVTANAIAAKLRGDGALSHADPKTLDGFGQDGVVGVAIHPEKDGYFAVVDSADGAQGIGAGGWSSLALLANHLGTDALWYRIYSPDLALGIRFNRGSSNSVVHAGTAGDVKAWLGDEDAPLAAAVPPKSAGADAVLFSVKYEREKYRSGPDASAAAALVAIAQGLIAGDAADLASKFERLDAQTRPFALGILRGETRGETAKAMSQLVKTITGAPLVTRIEPKDESFGEVVLQLAARSEPSDDVAAKLIARLDAIESEAQSRSSWAQPTGLWTVASALTNDKNHARAHAAWAALARRKEPHWLQVNMAVTSLLNASTGKIELTSETNATLAACEARVNELGEDAQNAILYNLACVYSRAGEADKALDRLSRCKTIRQQNPNPEHDTDLESIWQDPTFRELIADETTNDGALAQSVDDLEVSVRTTEVLAEKGVKTIADVVKLVPADLPKRVVAELSEVLAEMDIAWGAGEDDVKADYEVPGDRAVPRLKITLAPGDDDRALLNRIGGLPCAPSKDTPWPESGSRPMQLVAQLVGKAAGGEIDLGDIHVVQIFADMEGDYYEENEVIVHRKACPFILSAPVGCEPIPVQTMTLTPGADDAILLEDDEDDADAAEDARTHAWCDKVFGIPVGANLDPEIEDSTGAKMRLLLELTSYDDFFLWALFTNADFSEMKLEVVRG